MIANTYTIMTETNTNPEDERKRTIVLIYGVLENGTQFWIYAAVRPSKYRDFQDAYRESRLDVHNFGPYGEILVCGEGTNPPENVTVKVAEMYQTDAATLMASFVEEPPPGSK